MDPPTIRRFRGWTEEEWGQGVEQLRDRGILDATGELTAAGRSLRDGVEDMTDRLASGVWESVNTQARDQFFASLRRLAMLLEAPDGIQYPNPIGVIRPD